MPWTDPTAPGSRRRHRSKRWERLAARLPQVTLALGALALISADKLLTSSRGGNARVDHGKPLASGSRQGLWGPRSVTLPSVVLCRPGRRGAVSFIPSDRRIVGSFRAGSR
jgi:hypothetical protein